MSLHFGSMEFSGGIIEEIRIDRALVEVTTFGQPVSSYISGPASVTVTLRLTSPDAIANLMTSLGAAQADVARVLPAVEAVLGKRKVTLDDDGGA